MSTLHRFNLGKEKRISDSKEKDFGMEINLEASCCSEQLN